MFLTQHSPTSNGQRWKYDYSKHLFQSAQYLTPVMLRKGGAGKNLTGHITTRHRRRGSSRYLHALQSRIFYAKRLVLISTGVGYNTRIPVMYLMDRFRNIYSMRWIAGLTYGDRIHMFPLQPTWESADYDGSRNTLMLMWSGMTCCDLVNPRTGVQIATSAGTYCNILNLDFELRLVEVVLPSAKIKWLSSDYLCTVGRVAYEQYSRSIRGKAGTSYHLGWRPTVRGVAMNPVDHPHGGRTKTNSPEKSPWGWITKRTK